MNMDIFGKEITCVPPEKSNQNSDMPDELRNMIREMFIDTDIDEVVAFLPKRSEFSTVDGYERIVRAILLLSQGNLEKLKYYSKVADEDWRDLLYWAESQRNGEEPSNWTELLRQLGLSEEP